MKKWKKTFSYIKCLKNYEIELTWDLFIKGLNENLEYCFYYENLVIDIAFHYEDERKIYEINISNGDLHTHFSFNTVDELVYCKLINNKSIYDIWDELEN